MIDRQALLKDLQALLPSIERDILGLYQSQPRPRCAPAASTAKAKAANRTAEHFVAWREARIPRRPPPGF